MRWLYIFVEYVYLRRDAFLGVETRVVSSKPGESVVGEKFLLN